MTHPVFEAPESRWRDLWHRLYRFWGVQGDFQATYRDLVLAYTAPGRHYHNLQHLVQGYNVLLKLFAVHRTPAEQAACLEWAWWFHDFVYDHKPDDEARSAEVAKQRALACKLPSEFGQTAHDLVLATAHLGAPAELPLNAALLVDTDLSILGTSPEAFEAFEAQIRLEYREHSDPVFAKGRAQVLQKLLDRSPLYTSPYMLANYGPQAVVNLTRAVARWQALASDGR